MVYDDDKRLLDKPLEGVRILRTEWLRQLWFCRHGDLVIGMRVAVEILYDPQRDAQDLAHALHSAQQEMDMKQSYDRNFLMRVAETVSASLMQHGMKVVQTSVAYGSDSGATAMFMYDDGNLAKVMTKSPSRNN